VRIVDTRIKSAAIERLLKSFALSAFLCLGWGALSAYRARSLFSHLQPIEFLWLAYNAVVSFLFLIRRRPSIVSMDSIHWTVALVTSFSGFAFSSTVENTNRALGAAADIAIVAGLAIGIVSAIALGRNYDVLPAVRGVSTAFPYGVVRHPMYLSSIAIKTGYAIRHPCWYNAVLLLVVCFLYVKRAQYEEEIMMGDSRYVAYRQRVRFRFIPGLF
jgi:protein-S-isoprenylcysteine O-methyltransferase Ste14